MVIRILIILFYIFLVACGIRGNPVPPSYVEPKEKIQIFGDHKEEASQHNTQNFTSDMNLSKIGGDYNADLSEVTQQLPDLFEILKPQSADPKIVSPEISLE